MGDAAGESAENRPGLRFDRLEPYTWSDQESVAYEVALEAIGEVVSVCSAKIYNETKQPEPDQELLAAWHNELRSWVERRRALRATDHAGVARVRKEAPARAHYLDVRTAP